MSGIEKQSLEAFADGLDEEQWKYILGKADSYHLFRELMDRERNLRMKVEIMKNIMEDKQ